MARSLDQIIAELNPTFQPQVQSLQERANLIPGQIQSEESGLQAKQGEAFGDIVNSARRRGLGFSGIPLGEQAKYTATEYLPALARLRQYGQERAYSLQDAILGINERRDTLGQQILGQEKDRDFQTQQAELNRRAQAAAAAMPTYGNLGGATSQGAAGAPKIQKSNTGFAFFDAGGNPINAAQYAAQSGVPLRTLLTNMANDGDKNAQIGLQYLSQNGAGNSFASAPDQYRGALGALGATNFLTQGQNDLFNGTPLTNQRTGSVINLPSILNGRY